MGYTNKSTIYSMGLEEVLLLVVTSNQNRFAFEKGKQTGETQVETKGKKKENTLPHTITQRVYVVRTDEVGRVIMASADH